MIRSLRAADAATLCEIALRDPGFELSSRGRFFPADYVQEWLANPDDDVLLAAEEDGRVVGFVLCQVIRGRWALWHNFFMLPTHRRRGAGQALFDSAMEQLAAKGVRYCVAFAREPGALAFHVSNGASVGHSFTYTEWPVPTGANRAADSAVLPIREPSGA